MQMAPKLSGYEFYEKVLGSPKLIVAPMVEQSELAFRLMARKYGAQLCYTPMWHAGIFIRDSQYRRDALQSCPEDRPLIVQFCANDPDIFVQAGLLAESHCDAIDLNLGCPQVIARRGHYGAFLQDEWDLLHKMVRSAHEKFSVPVTCKIRVFPEIDKTVKYAKMLEEAGAQIITVHGRTRDQRGPLTGIASWDHIKAIKANVSIPVFANGNIQYGRDVERCLQHTGVDGVMCAEGILYNPAIFTCHQPPACEMAEEYLASAEKYSVLPGHVRGHLFRMLHHVLNKHLHYRNELGSVKTVADMKKITIRLKEICKEDVLKDKMEGKDSEEPGNIPYWRCQPYVRPPGGTDTAYTQCEAERCGLFNVIRVARSMQKVSHFTVCWMPTKTFCVNGRDFPTCLHEVDSWLISTLRPKLPAKRSFDQPKCNTENKPLSKKALKRIGRQKKLDEKAPKGQRWTKCEACNANPKGSKCAYDRCRKCCRDKSATEVLDCSGHQFKFKTKYELGKWKKATDIKEAAIGEVT